VSKAPYNPLDKLNLGKSVAEALLDQDAAKLGDLEPFPGAGIYAVYYSGAFEAYDRLRQANKDGANVPLYVGKAIPSGGRKGLNMFTETQGRFLYNRLQDHADSLRLASNLELEDFHVRWLAVDDIWIPLGETLIIAKFRPVWNLALDGFGNHDPGAGRYNGARPMWDELHPGRVWALRCQPRPESKEQLSERVRTFLASVNLPDDPHVSFDPSEI
jgi:hypothetical protein